jgi:hypothetical protein
MGKGKTKQTKKEDEQIKRKRDMGIFFFRQKEKRVKYRKKGGSFMAHGGKI